MQWLVGFWVPKRWITAKVELPIEHWKREHFLPFRPNQLIERLASQCNRPEEFDKLRPAIDDFKRKIRLQYQHHHEYLIDLYSQFDPDRDLSDRALEVAAEGSGSLISVDESICRSLFAEIADSLHHANYRRLSPREIQAAIGAASHWGVRLQIRFSSFRRLEVYGRGDIVTKRMKRDWRSFFRMREVDVPIYQRLVVVFRPKEMQSLNDPLDPTRVHLRMFKNIPKADIDMMLPGSTIRLSWLDTGKIGIPTLWGIFIMSSKLAKSLWIIALIGTLKVLSSFLFAIAIVLATIFYGVKSILSYTSTKRRYQLNITRSLYFQNLDNNLGALLRLETEAEQQELCEAILAYYVLSQAQGPLSIKEIDLRAEFILESLTGCPIDFDVDEAIRYLGSLGVFRRTDQGWTLAA
ncbi:MAG: TMEM143 family protein, partial [Pirellula sp.]